MKSLGTLLFSAALFAVYPLFGSSPEAAVSPDETVITGKRLEMQNDGQRAYFVFSEAVRLEGNNLTVTCDLLELYSERLDEAEETFGELGRIRLIVASGNVLIEQEGRTARAERAEVRPLEDKIVLTGNPVVTDAQGTVSGAKMTFFRGQQQGAIVESGEAGPVRVRLPMLPDLGYSPQQAPPPPQPPPPPAEEIPPADDAGPAQ